MTRTDKVLEWLKKHGHINPMEALRYCGAYRLSDIIYRLKRHYIITTELGDIREDGTRECCTYYYHGRRFEDEQNRQADGIC